MKAQKTTPAYAGIARGLMQTHVALSISGKTRVMQIDERRGELSSRFVTRYVSEYAKKYRIKIVAAALSGHGDLHALGSRLWLEQDITPILSLHRVVGKYGAALLAEEARRNFNGRQIPIIRFGARREVNVSYLVQLRAYEKITDRHDFEQLMALADQFKSNNGRLIFFSSTARGGGVALMRHALIRLYRLLGVKAHWHVMSNSDNAVFGVTKKKFHNVLQSIAPPDVVLTDQDIAIYEHWIKKNVRSFTPLIKKSDIIVIDDPQPSGMIPHIRRIHTRAKIIYRSHIHLETGPLVYIRSH